MAKIMVILSTLLVLGAADPQGLQQKPGTPLQERKTKMDWEQITNTIEEVFGIASDGKQQEEQEAIEQAAEERRNERKREFIENQQEGTGLENREERSREAIGRAQGRLPAREVRRRQQNFRQQQQWGLKRQDQQQQGEKKDRYYNDFPLYEFAYGVHDPETGDNKEQWEKRVGDHVKGKYTLDQPDGTKRVVEYEADDKSGFEAIVKEIDRIDDRHRGNVRWGHSDGLVAQSYSKLKKVD
ncbi:capping protein inhibiting regulator of actin dynamics-like [Anopheles maculipalpis]|uniref:capping protein inhibiting regulator of actin dynamics-like n=1 Tax=Anopheles maculipalpis TaxID=1496333 RepID=UPI00215936B9|nr:capping protein inhibiting regulator of actin dynamics-like [Anopheles maculipalpis]